MLVAAAHLLARSLHLQDLGTQDQTRKQGSGRQLRSSAAKGAAGRGQPSRHPQSLYEAAAAADALVKSDSIESQKEMDALQGLCDLKGM